MDFTLGGIDIQAGFPLDVTLLSVGLLVGWWGLVRRHGGLLASGDQPPVTRRQAIAWVSGVVLFWLSDGWPLAAMSEHLFSFHMLQHLLQALVIPPLLLMGLPEWMGDVLLRNDRVRRVVAWLAGPVVAGVLFNVVFVATHVPQVVAAQLSNELVHAADHLLLIGGATLMWVNVMSPFPTILRELRPLPQMFYLFLMTLLPTIPSAFLIFGESALYPVYAPMARPWGMTLVADMQMGGLIMKLGGGFWLWGVIAVKYFRWASANERAEREQRRRRHEQPSPPTSSPR